ncbi:MAG: hypothetical protein LBS63_00095, partial [Prevotellaceae bacterium]|nr:hypothetical protein [Prevotellaceae bacterium]
MPDIATTTPHTHRRCGGGVYAGVSNGICGKKLHLFYLLLVYLFLFPISCCKDIAAKWAMQYRKHGIFWEEEEEEEGGLSSCR